MTVLRGMAVPFRIAAGGVRQSSGSRKVADDLRHLLSTRLGERVLRRGYGAGVQNRLQDPNDDTLHTLVQHEIELALIAHLPEARLTGPIRITHDESELTVAFDYTVAATEPVERVAVTLPRSS